MMDSDTAIVNLALSHLGSGNEIQSLESSRTPEAACFRRIYDTCLRATLRDYAWPFAKKIAALGLVTSISDTSHPTQEWNYSYRYPSDCLMDRKIQSGIRNDNRQSRVPYVVARDSNGLLIYTDQEDAILEYTILMEEVEKYPADFVLAFSLRLAMYAAPRICGKDPFKMGQRAANLYQFEISAAKANSFNEQQHEEDPASELERARE